jgi:hypothetical protein
LWECPFHKKNKYSVCQKNHPRQKKRQLIVLHFTPSYSFSLLFIKKMTFYYACFTYFWKNIWTTTFPVHVSLNDALNLIKKISPADLLIIVSGYFFGAYCTVVILKRTYWSFIGCVLFVSSEINWHWPCNFSVIFKNKYKQLLSNTDM